MVMMPMVMLAVMAVVVLVKDVIKLIVVEVMAIVVIVTDSRTMKILYQSFRYKVDLVTLCLDIYKAISYLVKMMILTMVYNKAEDVKENETLIIGSNWMLTSNDILFESMPCNRQRLTQNQIMQKC